MPMAASPLNATRNCRSSSVNVLVVVRLSTYSRPSTRSAEAMSGEHMALRTLWSRIDWPRKRESAGAFCDTTATRSCMTLSAIDRGICMGWTSPRRLREMVGTSSPVSSFRSTMVTRSTLMISKVTSTTARSSRSRSSSAESFWETSSSIWSLRAWRASPRRRLHLELAQRVGGPGW